MDIAEFAQKIGVSPTTVSHAINGRGRVSTATRQMVLTRMKELGYTPGLHAQQLASGRSQMIALHHPEHDFLSNMFLVEIAHGVQHALQAHGYGLLLDTVPTRDGQRSSLVRWIRSQAIDGVIVKKFKESVREWVQELANPRTPFVVIDDCSVIGLPYVGSVNVDWEFGVHAVADLLIEKGHRRIGFIGNILPNPLLEAFRQRLQGYDVALPEKYVLIAGMTQNDGARAMRELMSQPTPPTAIFACTDVLAFGASYAALSMGVSIPSQVSLVGFDDVPLAALVYPPLTTVRIDCFEIGKSATETLLALQKEPHKQPEAKFVPTSLILRDSVSTPP